MHNWFSHIFKNSLVSLAILTLFMVNLAISSLATIGLTIDYLFLSKFGNIYLFMVSSIIFSLVIQYLFIN